MKKTIVLALFACSTLLAGSAVVTPEPGTAAMMGAAVVAGLWIQIRRSRKKNQK